MNSILDRVSAHVTHAKSRLQAWPRSLRDGSGNKSKKRPQKKNRQGRFDFVEIPAFLRRARGSAPKGKRRTGGAHRKQAQRHTLPGLVGLFRRGEFPLSAVAPDVALNQKAATPAEVMHNMRQFAGRYLHAEEPHRAVIGVVSPTAGDGRSTLAMGLASALVDMYSNVLLVETQSGRHSADFWAQLHIKQQPGLREFLDQGLKLDDIIRRTGKENLWLLPAGSADGSRPLSLDDVSRLHSLLAQLNELFAVVVVDLPPLLQSEAAPALLNHLDAAVMVASAQQTTTSQLNQALTLCNPLPLRGLLLNKEATRTPRWVESLVLSS